MAHAQIGITRANQLFPSAIVGVDIFSRKTRRLQTVPPYQVNAVTEPIGDSGIFDFWGNPSAYRSRSGPYAPQAEWGSGSVISALVANVATPISASGARQANSKSSEAQHWPRGKQSLKLSSLKSRFELRLDVSQSQQLVYTASETISRSERQFSTKICSASAVAKSPVSITAVSPLRSSPFPEARSRWSGLQNCSKVARTFGSKQNQSWQPTPSIFWGGAVAKASFFQHLPHWNREG